MSKDLKDMNCRQDCDANDILMACHLPPQVLGMERTHQNWTRIRTRDSNCRNRLVGHNQQHCDTYEPRSDIPSCSHRLDRVSQQLIMLSIS